MKHWIFPLLFLCCGNTFAYMNLDFMTSSVAWQNYDDYLLRSACPSNNLSFSTISTGAHKYYCKTLPPPIATKVEIDSLDGKLKSSVSNLQQSDTTLNAAILKNHTSIQSLEKNLEKTLSGLEAVILANPALRGLIDAEVEKRVREERENILKEVRLLILESKTADQ